MTLLAALALQIEWGADEALADRPINRLAPAPAVASPPQRRPAPPAHAAPREGPSPAAARDMAALLAAYAAFEGCRLRDTATSFVGPAGEPATGLVWLTGPPGEDDDRTGRAGSGPDGALLDRMLASIGLDRRALLLVPIIPWRPPGGRPPSAAEIALCLPFLQRLLVLAGLRTLVLEAGLPAQTFLPRGAGRTRREAAALTPLALPDLSAPAAALVIPALSSIRQSAERRRDAWQRLRLLRRHLDDGLAKS